MPNHQNSRWNKKILLAGIVPLIGVALLGWTLVDLQEQSPEIMLSTQGENVQPHLAVDAKGTIYADWIQIVKESPRVMFTKSEDGGRTFQTPVAASPPEMDLDPGADGGAQIAVGPQGQIYLAWGGTMSQEPTMRPSGFSLPDEKPVNNTRAALEIYFSRSLDGGKRFSTPQIVNDDVKAEASDSLDKEFRHRLPTLDVDANNNIYIAWIDKRNGDSLDPNLTYIYLTKSTDGGTTFQPNVKASLQQETTCICCTPNVSASANGEVAVTFRNSIDEIKDMYSSFSRDGGKTFHGMMAVNHGGWQFFGCPMSGPSTLMRSDELDVAWGDGAAQGEPGHNMDIGLTVFYSHKGSADLKFAPRQTLSQNGNHPKIVATSSGMLFAVWEEYSKNGADIYLAEIGKSGAEPRRRISYSDSGYYPSPAASPDGGELYVAWKDIRGDNPQVYFRTLPAEGRSFTSMVSAALFRR